MKRRRITSLCLAVATQCLVSACERQDEPVAADKTAPPSLRATVSIEPPTLAIGEVATLEMLVVTPPGHHVLPMVPPEIPGVWLLESRALDVEKQASRWLHRTLVRVRPQDVGPHEWPERAVEVENSEGERVSVVAPSRDFMVRSTMPDVPERVSPFGYQTARAAPKTTRGWIWAAGGACFAWAVTGAVFLALRRRNDPEEPAPIADGSGPTELFAWIEQELRDARAALAVDDPDACREAANRSARALRQFVARRFDTETEANTTPELAALRPPLRVQSRWPHFVRILQALDDWRFRPVVHTAPADPRDSLTASLDEVARFVESAARKGAR